MAGWSRLDSSIIHSSLWLHDHATVRVWITIIALKDGRGHLKASVPGLAGAARVTIEECRRALAIFEAPDPDSSDGGDGVRLVREEGGWYVTGHPRYKPDDPAERMRQMRARRAGDAVTGVTPVTSDAVTPTPPHPTATELQPSSARAKVLDGPTDYTTRCVVAANGAIQQRVPAFRPLVASSERELGTATGWERDGIPLETALAVIRERVDAYQVTRGNQQPRSLKYFDGAVREAFERGRTSAEADPRVDLVASYHGKVCGYEDQLVTRDRERMLRARLAEGDVSELLYAADGLAANEYARKNGRMTLEDCYRNRGEVERFAKLGGYKPGKVHPWANAKVTAA